MLTRALNQYISTRIDQGLHRQRQVLDTSLLNFSSNDYLSLASDARVQRGFQEGFGQKPAGSGGSMLVSGYHAAHKALEQGFAEALGVDACMVFSSGYTANLSVIGLLAQLGTHVLIDKSVHASIYDGLVLSGASYSRYLHQDLADMSLKTQTTPENTVLMTESIFSMSGQIAPLKEMSRLHPHALFVDEAHAFGVLGPEGLGSVVQAGLTQDDVPLRMIPLGKAYAASGAIIAGQGAWIDALLQAARPHCYSTAISPAFAHGLLNTLDIIRASDARRDKLNALVHYFRQAIATSPLQWRDSHTPIQQLQLGDPHRAVSFATRLREQGILCMPMRQPTVSLPETGLRVILNYHHEPADIDRLFQCLHAS